jgi:hypothetical protein
MLSENFPRLRAIGSVRIALFGLALGGQIPDGPKPVPMTEEPHHHLIFENSYVRVFRFALPAHEATLLHAHDFPYISVALGPTEFTNAVVGKTETHSALADGQVGYSRGGFTHIVRTDTGSSFHNFTIELLHPQGDPRNLCQKITDGPFNECPAGDVDQLSPNAPLRTLAQAMKQERLFETAEVVVTSFSASIKEDYSETGPQTPRLLVVEQDSNLQVDSPEESPKRLHGGEILWLEAGKEWRIVTAGDHKVTRFLLIQFKEANR